MSSLKKIEANRANARKSTGPRTETGKAASRTNAVRHGLTGKQLIANGEDPAAYEALRDGLIDSYQPANSAEDTLVEEIAQNYWRLQRVRLIEAESFRCLGGGVDINMAFGFGVERFDVIRRYMTSIERAWRNAILQLEKMQAARAAQAAPEPERGFVSQKSPRPAKPSPEPAPTQPFLTVEPGRKVTPSHFPPDEGQPPCSPA